MGVVKARVRRRRRLRLAFLLVPILLLFAVPARAQDQAEKPFEEPGVSYLPRRSPYIQWIAGALFVAACLFVAFKNPHRTHLD